MKNKPVKQVKSSLTTTLDANPYLNNLEQDGWNDIQAYHIETQSAWRFVAIVAIMALMIVALIAMYLVNQDKHKTIVFERDSQDNLSLLGIATKTLPTDNRVIAHQLANFITALREVPQEVDLKRRNIDIVHKMLEPKLKESIDKTIIDQYTKAKDSNIFIKLSSLKPITGAKSWEVRWSENNATTSLITHWSAIITFKQVDAINPDVQIINPLGLVITYVNLAEDINDKN
jgi:type IV secretory pathway TrbF-like protein